MAYPDTDGTPTIWHSSVSTGALTIMPDPPFTTTIPTSNLRSLTVGNTDHDSCLEPVHDLLVASKNLEFLKMSYIPAQFHPERGRLPPIKSLILNNFL